MLIRHFMLSAPDSFWMWARETGHRVLAFKIQPFILLASWWKQNTVCIYGTRTLLKLLNFMCVASLTLNSWLTGSLSRQRCQCDSAVLHVLLILSKTDIYINLGYMYFIGLYFILFLIFQYDKKKKKHCYSANHDLFFHS